MGSRQRPLGPFLGLLLLTTGCAYTLQSQASRRLKDELGVERVYVAPVINNTYKPGVENVVYNALVRTLATSRRVRIVPSRETADAILVGSVWVASAAVAGSTSVEKLNPLSLPLDSDLGKAPVATEYAATLGCHFELQRTAGALPPPTAVALPPSGHLWTGTFERSKRYRGANQVGPSGTTSALINESEFERALGDLARQMMDDVQEAMLAQF